MRALLGDPGIPGSSTDVRIYPLAKQVEKHGVLWSFLAPSKAYTLNVFKRHIFPYSLKESLRLLLDHKGRFDVLFISRISSFLTYLVEKKATEKVIFDLDDPVFLPSRKILGVKVRSPYFNHVEKIMKSSKVVTASSHHILAYARNFNRNSFLIHTPVDTKEFSPSIRKKSKKFTIGWVGNAHRHEGNLNMLIPALTELGKHYDIRFRMVSYLGSDSIKKAFRKVEKYVQVHYGSKDWVPMGKLPRSMCDFDVLVSPLAKTSWFEGKSAVKVAIGMAIGVPVVASPVGEQKYVVEHGVNGFVAVNEEEWYLYLKALIENGGLRKKMEKEARKTAEKELSVEINGEKLYKIIKNLTANN